MIQKRLLFVWLGDNKPNYVDFAINAFKEVNPSFIIDFIHFSDQDVEDSKSYKGNIAKILKPQQIDCIKKDSLDPDYNNRYKSFDSVYKIKLSVPLRFSYLYLYGGIYLDCDTFPIKPFDDELLSKNKFICQQNNNKKDCFFIGYERNCKDKSCLLPTRSGYGNNLHKNEKYMDLCTKFYNCTLKYGDHFNDPNIHYIDHYWLRTFKY